MLPKAKRGKDPDPKYNLPHAKLTQVADMLVAKNLLDGSLHKTLVFARRLDTVDELVLLLLSRFQGAVDARIGAWREYLAKPSADVVVSERPWRKGRFWTHRWRHDDAPLHEAPQVTEDEGGDDLSLRTTSLPYLQALRRASKRQAKNGMLASFHSQLLAPPSKRVPFHGFLLQRPTVLDSAEEAPLWEAARHYWEQLLALLIHTSTDQVEPAHAWLYDKHASSGEAAWKLATLKRCILQSMRQSEFIVDLYVVNRYIGSTPGKHGGNSLPAKLLWMLTEADSGTLPKMLALYLRNWKARLRLWLVHFDLIVDKCLRKDGARTWEDIYKRVDGSFARMAPVMGRSGRLKDRNAVTQFNFPTHPNILICTDVLKEGVDMHLFCDDIVHYGVAWTSGDLEQRIGRIDRLGSQIGRRIANYVQPDVGSLPQLKVEFPYLEGTLDRYQVERVMVAKVKSDLRMDLGKHEDEIGHITIGHIDNPREDDLGTMQEAMEQYPEDTIAALDGDIAAPGSFVTLKPLAVVSEAVVHAPEFRALIHRQSWGGLDEALLRKTPHAEPGKRTVMRLQEEYLVAIDGASAKPGLTVGEALRHAPAFAVSTLPYVNSFHFDQAANTLVRIIKLSNPFIGDQEPRTQIVLLERVRDYMLLRTPVARLGDPKSDFSRDQWATIIPGQNARRRWGYLVVEQDTVWFVCLLLATSDSRAGDILEILSERVGKIGNRLRQLHCPAIDHKQWGYRSRTSIADIAEMAASHDTYFRKRQETFMTTNTDDLRACGRLLDCAQQWLTEGFEVVLNTLYAGSMDPRSLTVMPITLLPSGVLHISVDGKERFNINAYLQLASNREVDGAFAAPRMIWQVAVSTSSRGPKPELRLWGWTELPHAMPNDWEGEIQENGAIYHYRDDNVRYLVLYHTPVKWDMARTEIRAAWANLLGRMNGEKFQQSQIYRSFFNALADG